MEKKLNVINKEKRQDLFLKAYSKCGIVGHACDAVGISRSTVHQWRDTDQEFKKRMLAAHEDALDLAELELRRRGIEGVEEPVIFSGKVVYKRDPYTGEIIVDDDGQPIPLTINRRSDRLLEVFMQAKRPEYNRKSGVEIGIGPRLIGEDSDDSGQIVIKFVDSDGEGNRLNKGQTIEAEAVEVDDFKLTQLEPVNTDDDWDFLE